MPHSGAMGSTVVSLGSDMLLAIFMTLILATGEGPMHAALGATEAPPTLRAAFTVELRSAMAQQVVEYDPRRPLQDRWRVIIREGEDPELDAVAANWAADPSPDARLFADDLRSSLGRSVEVNTDGPAWRLSFQHQPNQNDTEFDVWAANRLRATAWLDPVGERFLQIDYKLPRPVSGPTGGKLTRYSQSYFLKTEPRWGLSYVSGFAIDLEARIALRRIQRQYSAEVTDIYLFFASTAAEEAFLAGQQVTGSSGVAR